MSVIISEYYLDELDARKICIDRFLEQIEECEQLLKEIPRFHSFSHLAEKTERHLKQLYLAKQHFLADLQKVDDLENKLHEEDLPLQNSKVTSDIDEELNRIWEDELSMDTSFLQVRTGCRKFLYGVVVSPHRQIGEPAGKRLRQNPFPIKKNQQSYLL